ncbi:non-ribosomal peptide synthetase, partial [Enhygromyxa salina]|uniref:non-ribosomal peptide synthetase n=1 Tax=Enhygromyxa salina TaxID=215803 RepID=UPI0011BA871F
MTKLVASSGRVEELVRKLERLSPKQRRALLAVLDQRGVDLSVLDGVPMLAANDEAPVRLSFAQQRLWFLAQLDGPSAAYNIPLAVRLRGPLDRPALLRALDDIVARHEALRTRVVERDGVPYQEFHAPGELVVRERSLADLAALDAVCEAEITAPFELEGEPLFRALLIELGVDDHALVVTMHHGVSDGWSIGVFVRELVALYEAHRAGRPPRLAPLPVRYADYANWQRAWLDRGAQAAQLEYWTAQLAGVDPRLTLPTDRERPAAKTYAGARVQVEVPLAVLDGIRALAQDREVTLYMVLLAAYGLVLHRYTRATDLAVGTVVANRPRAELEGLIGYFANTLVMRIDLSGGPSFAELLARVKHTALAAYAHQELPFEAIVEALQVERALNLSPVFQTMFVLQEAQDGASAQVGGLEVSPIELDPKVTKFDLGIEVYETPTGLAGFVEYNRDLYEQATIEGFIGHYSQLLAALAEAEADTLARAPAWGLPMIGAAEGRRLVELQTGARRPYPEPRCLHELFEDQVRRHGDRVALVSDSGSWTYAELNTWANRIAHQLRAAGVGPDQPVGLYAERSPVMVAAIYATLKAGGAYMPIDPGYPAGRVAEIVERSRVAVVLTRPQLDVAPLAGAATCLTLLDDGRIADAAGVGLAPISEANIPAAEIGLDARKLAYVIHTSGSTGRPKGVMIEHRAAHNRIDWMQHEYRLGEDDVVLQKTPFGFDVSVWEFFWPLLHGARLVVAEAEGHKDPAYLTEVIERHGVTTLHFVPSMFRAMLDEPGWARCRSVRQVFCSGEALSPELCVRHYQRLPTAALHNLYGPTEAAVDVSHWPVPNDPALAAVPIGRPIQNIELYVLDEDRAVVPIGCVGELYIAGHGLARGYLHAPEQSRERFVPNPLASEPGARMYRTGDLARLAPDGALHYLGRIDDQIKLRGFRIELGEIECRLGEQPEVHACAVVLREDQPGNQQLVAYVVLDPGLTLADCRAKLELELGGSLPEYMVPRAFVALVELPVTANGKLDRKALPVPGREAFVARSYVAPRTELERALAQVWAEVLELEPGVVGAEDSFFSLGGHSLLIPVLVAKLRERGLTVSVRAVFSAPTLAELAKRLDRGGAPVYVAPANAITPGCERLTPSMVPLVDLRHEELDAIVAAIPGGAAQVQDIYPLVATQEGILFHHLMDPDHDPYLVSTLFRVDDEPACARFVAAVQALVDRHDALRTAVVTKGVREPVQVVHRSASVAVERVRVGPGGDARARAEAILAAPGAFDIARAPLLRLFIVEQAGEAQRHVIVNAHHLIEDATSLRMTLAELAVHMSGRSELLAAPGRYRDFVAHTLHQQRSVAIEAEFRAMLGGVDEPTLPFGLDDARRDARRVARLRHA